MTKPCAEGQERNPDTNRCRKICPSGTLRHPKTKRCVKHQANIVPPTLPLHHSPPLPRVLSQPKMFYSNNAGTSCYIDTLLFALLYNPNKWIHKNLLKAVVKQNTLKRVTESVKAGIVSAFNKFHSSYGTSARHCGALRAAFKAFDQEYYAELKTKGFCMPDRVEWLTTQNEPIDVARILARVFTIPDDVSVTIKLPSGESRKEKHVFFDISVRLDSLLNSRRVTFPVPTGVDAFIDETTQRVITKTTTVNDAHLLMVNAERNYIDERKLKTKIDPPETVTLAKGRLLWLRAIIVHHGARPVGGHYTTVFKALDGSWREYDDLSNQHYKLIGKNLTIALNYNDKYIQKNGSVYIYMD